MTRPQVLSAYKELIALIHRLPAAQRQNALKEAREKTKQRKGETNPQACLEYFKELVSKLGYLRTITPRYPTDKPITGVYVVRDGNLVKTDTPGEVVRVKSTTLDVSEAMARNARDYKRFYGKEKSSNVLF